jgi:uncharacterized protein YukE
MGDITDVDVPALRAAQPQVAAIASQLASALGQLNVSLAGEGVCWGNDEIGEQFASAYLPALETVRHAFTDLHNGVESIATSLSTVADNATAVDTRTDQRFA